MGRKALEATIPVRVPAGLVAEVRVRIREYRNGSEPKSAVAPRAPQAAPAQRAAPAPRSTAEVSSWVVAGAPMTTADRVGVEPTAPSISRMVEMTVEHTASRLAVARDLLARMTPRAALPSAVVAPHDDFEEGQTLCLYPDEDCCPFCGASNPEHGRHHSVKACRRHPENPGYGRNRK